MSDEIEEVKRSPEEIASDLENLESLVKDATETALKLREAALLTVTAAKRNQNEEANKAADDVQEHLAHMETIVDDFSWIARKHDVKADDLYGQMHELHDNAHKDSELAETNRPKSEIKLVVAYKDQQQVDAFMPIRWCLNKCAAEVINEGAEEYPTCSVLISVVHETAGEVDRRVTPLEAMMDYLKFNRAGKYTIYALAFRSKAPRDSKEAIRQQFEIVRRETPSSFEKTLFERGWDNGKDERMLVFHPEWLEHDTDSIHLICYTSIPVEVPEEFFAKEPPRLLMDWVTLIWNDPIADQCAFRRRLIFAFTIQPLLVLAWLVLKYGIGLPAYTLLKFMVAIGGTLFGVRPRTAKSDRTCFSVDWKAVLGGGFCDIDEVLDLKEEAGPCHDRNCQHTHHGGTFQFRKSDGYKRLDDGRWASVFSWLRTPLVWVAALGLGYKILHSIGMAFLFGLLTAMVLAAGTAVVFLIFIAIETIKEKRRALVPAQKVTKQEVVVRKRQLEGAMNKLLCETMPVEVDVSALPREQQTIRLKFMKLKARVCRPFAY